MTIPRELAALPDEALVPVHWVLRLLEEEYASEAVAGPGLTVAAAAEIIGRAPSTVRAWCAAERLPGAFRLGGREWRIPSSAISGLSEGGDPPQAPVCETLVTPRGGLGAWRRERS